MANINDPNVSRTSQAIRGSAMTGSEHFNPLAEDNYWRENISSRPYAHADLGYSHYEVPSSQFPVPSSQFPLLIRRAQRSTRSNPVEEVNGSP